VLTLIVIPVLYAVLDRKAFQRTAPASIVDAGVAPLVQRPDAGATAP
jgi:hypothetical protein